MPAPYTAEEVAAALIAAVKTGEPFAGGLTVIGDEKAHRWVIRIRRAGGEHTLTFPFASPAGIYTPAEIAAHIVSGGWPFG